MIRIASERQPTPAESAETDPTKKDLLRRYTTLQEQVSKKIKERDAHLIVNGVTYATPEELSRRYGMGDLIALSVGGFIETPEQGREGRASDIVKKFKKLYEMSEELKAAGLTPPTMEERKL